MKTLVFCTSWADSADTWRYRYGKWLRQMQRSPLHYRQILLVDDASPLRPDFPGLALYDAESLPSDCPGEPVVMARFNQRLGRKAVCDYPGWWRSFMFAAEYASRFGFDKLVHVESDTYVLSQGLYDYLNALDSGWTAFWCPRWRFPETCIQVIGPDQLPRFRAVAAKSYASLVGQPVEELLPFTRVEANFKGDRYGEYRTELPLDADYASQVPWNTPVWYGQPPAPRRVLALSLGHYVVPPHQALYPRDSWQLQAAAPVGSPEALQQQLAVLPVEAMDAVQLTLTQPVSNLPVAEVRRVLTEESELLINLRPGVGRDAATAMAKGLLPQGFASVGLEGAAALGEWILAACQGASLPQVLSRERLQLRLRLLAECRAG